MIVNIEAFHVSCEGKSLKKDLLCSVFSSLMERIDIFYQKEIVKDDKVCTINMRHI